MCEDFHLIQLRHHQIFECLEFIRNIIYLFIYLFKCIMINLKKKLFDFFQVPSVLSFSLAGTFNQDNSRRFKGLDLPEIVICFNPIFIRFIHKDTHVVILVVSRSLRVLKVSCRSG